MNNTTVSTEQLENVLYTLQYALETFAGACNCGECDPCTNGQRDLREAIDTMQAHLTERRG